jgi:hypothetical protein
MTFLDRLIAAEDRARQFRTDLGILTATIADIILFRPPRASLPPDGKALFPLQCDDCGAAIRFATDENPNARRTGTAVFRDRHGCYSCDGSINRPHKPKTWKDPR